MKLSKMVLLQLRQAALMLIAACEAALKEQYGWQPRLNGAAKCEQPEDARL